MDGIKSGAISIVIVRDESVTGLSVKYMVGDEIIPGWEVDLYREQFILGQKLGRVLPGVLFTEWLEGAYHQATPL